MSTQRPAASQETRATAERLGASALSLEVAEVSAVSSGLRRITLTDPLLAGVSYQPGQDLTLSVPRPGGAGTVKRRYTIRHLDRARASVDLDVVLHGDGPGARWARDVTAGDWIEAIGPRGKISVEAGAAWHLFVGDESYLPAAFVMAESLPAGAGALVVLEHGDDVDELTLTTAADLHGPVWVRRNGQAAALLDALRGLELPAGAGHAYVGGEAQLVTDARDLLVSRGLDPAAVSAKPYWRVKQANADHGEPARD